MPESSCRSRSIAATKRFVVDNARIDSRQFQRTVAGPLHDVEKDSIAFARRGTPRAWFERTAARAINAVAVLFQPSAHFFEPSHLPRFDSSVGHRADVEKKIAIAANGLQERL